MLNSLAFAVRHTSTTLWHGLGIMFIVLAVFLAVYMIISSIIQLRESTLQITGCLFNIIIALAVGWCFLFIGQAITRLPMDIYDAAGKFIGLSSPQWLNSVSWSKPAIMLMGIFMAMGSQGMLMYLAALSNVPIELMEAASIDGANRWKIFRFVTWPQLAPTTFFIVITGVMGGLQGGFETAQIMTLGGPAGSTTTLSYYLYERGFTDFQLGFASAIAWAMFVMIFIITMVNWKFGNTMVNE
jgi:multiple sugar transport system permease protein